MEVASENGEGARLRKTGSGEGVRGGDNGSSMGF